jgi:hypothetical protein
LRQFQSIGRNTSQPESLWHQYLCRASLGFHRSEEDRMEDPESERAFVTGWADQPLQATGNAQ